MRFLHSPFVSVATLCAATTLVSMQAARPAYADLTVVQTRTISGLENIDSDLYSIPLKSKFYYKGDFYREEVPGRSIRIYDAKNDKLFILDPSQEIYMVTSMKDAEQRASFQALPGTEVRYAMDLNSGGTSDKIAGLPAKNFILEAKGVVVLQSSGQGLFNIKVDGEMWMTEKLKLPSKNERLLKMSLAIFPPSFRMVSPDLYQKIKATNGLPLSYNATLNVNDGGANSISLEVNAKAESVSTKTLSQSLFKVPGNYRRATLAQEQRLLSR